MLKRIKSANNKLSIIMTLIFGIGCFCSGVEYGRVTNIFETQGAIYTLDPSTIAFFEFVPFILILGLLGIFKFILYRYIKSEVNNSEKI